MSDRLRFGAFFAPFHPVGQNPTLSLEYDLDRAVALDRFGFDECWFGEHHSGGYETIACPELLIAAAAERTKHIGLGTGVVSLPYHHPFVLADRLVQLDHMTRGRFIFGAGPGALPTDAYMMGIDPVDQRRRMEESLEAILRLFAGETVSMETDWFTLRDARLHVRPYSHPHPEVAVAAMVTPSGPRLAGRMGTGLLSLSMQVADGFAAIGKAWGVVEEQAAAAGRPAPDRRSWRVLGTMHLAETREQAIEDCTYGLPEFAGYFGGGAGFVPLAQDVGGEPTTRRELVEAYAESGSVVIGTPADAVEYIQGLLDQSGGFGTFLLLGHDWANPERTIESFRLFAREVIPHFTGQLEPPRVSHDWATAKRGELFGRAGQAMLHAITTHVEEREAARVDEQAADAAERHTNGRN
ncbi:MAG TPA: LLM class flavin-dependent oxidoreductase [Acidimicrobiales bacterium]|nr:LLM class flavin-dependent oxidoreductase [Acidimicrobiales bacterium]